MTDRRQFAWLRLGLRFFRWAQPTEAHWNLAWAASIGVAGALVALVFAAMTKILGICFTGSTNESLQALEALPWWQKLAVPTLGGLAAGVVLTLGQRYVRQKPTDYMEAMRVGDGRVPARSSLYRSLAALFSIASGEAIGKEGPLVQLTAMVASQLGRLRHLAPPRRRLLVACGAAAGIAAAYNTPLTAALFVAEITLESLAMETLGPLIVAAFASIMTVRMLSDAQPLYHLRDFTVQGREMALFGVTGLVCGLMACVFLEFLEEFRLWFRKLPWPLMLKLAAGGLVVGLLTLGHVEVTGNGYNVVHSLLQDPWVWRAVLLTLLCKMVATSVVFGSGAVGGVFTPTLTVGACTGYLCWAGFAHLFPEWALASPAYVAIGMGATLAAATQAPIMSILMIIELTLSYEITIPLMLATVISYYVVRSVGVASLYRRAPDAADVFERPLEQILVGDIMQTHPGTVPPQTGFAEVARRFVAGGARRQYVVGADGRLAGVVRLEDLEGHLHSLDFENAFIARDLAHEDAASLGTRTPVAEALVAFTHAREPELPVLHEKSGKLAGTLSRNDLLLTLAEAGKRSARRR